MRSMDTSSYTLYCVWVLTSGRTQGAAAEEDAVGEHGEQQPKRTQSGSSKLKWTQSGHSLVWPRETCARQRLYRTRLLVCQSRVCQTHTEMMKEVRPQKHSYVCNGERTVVHHEELQVDCSHRRMKPGCLESVDWITGLEYWNGLNCCKKPFLDMTAF